ncbi:MAG TPA: SDR family NAD(P)-dependent oxidoreductase, partial [Xanthobacteraceae bacterium]
MRLADKVAIVTGAGSGMGASIAETYAREGARVAVLEIDADAAKKVARGIGNTALALGCDVAKSAEIDAAIRSTLAAYDRVDIL